MSEGLLRVICVSPPFMFRKAASATTVGLCVLGVGWLLVALAVTIKLVRLKLRRKASTDE